MKKIESDIVFWKKALETLPDSYKSWFKDEKTYLRKNVNNKTRLLDVACGDGKGLLMVYDIILEGVGVDYEKAAVNFAKKNLKDAQNIRIILADAVNLPFKDNYFDVVICIGSLCNAADNKLKWLTEMRRVIKKGGDIILSVYSEDAFNERMGLYKRLNVPIVKIEGTKVILDKRKVKDYISEQFSRRELEDLFKKAELKTIEVAKSGIGYICKLRK